MDTELDISKHSSFISGESGTVNDPHAQIMLRGAFGVELKHLYLGISASTLVRNIKYKDYNIDIATESFRIFIGKRFDIAKKRSRKH